MSGRIPRRVPGRVEDRGKVIPTLDHPPRNILMGGSGRGSVGRRVMGFRHLGTSRNNVILCGIAPKTPGFRSTGCQLNPALCELSWQCSVRKSGIASPNRVLFAPHLAGSTAADDRQGWYFFRILFRKFLWSRVSNGPIDRYLCKLNITYGQHMGGG